MYIPSIPERKNFDFLVQDEVEVFDQCTIEDLIEFDKKANELNVDPNHKVKFTIWSEDEYSEGSEAKAAFTYKRKPNRKKILSLKSISYREVEQHNKFVKDHPELAKALDRKLMDHFSYDI
jgi:hypothetical protein